MGVFTIKEERVTLSYLSATFRILLALSEMSASHIFEFEFNVDVSSCP